jgi:hypothetical protein
MKNVFLALLFACGLAVSASAQELPVLLIVDNTHPANVVFTATGHAAVVNDDSGDMFWGISLFDLFAGSGFIQTTESIEGDLSPNGTSSSYTRIVNNEFSLGTG